MLLSPRELQLAIEEEKKIQEIQEKADLDDMMSGRAGLEIFCHELKEMGIELPARDVWKHAKRSQIEGAVHATFSLIGGIPAMALWAHRNPDLFYPNYMKLAPAESQLNQNGIKISINTAIPESPLDRVELTTLGSIIDDVEENE